MAGAISILANQPATHCWLFCGRGILSIFAACYRNRDFWAQCNHEAIYSRGGDTFLCAFRIRPRGAPLLSVPAGSRRIRVLHRLPESFRDAHAIRHARFSYRLDDACYLEHRNIRIKCVKWLLINHADATSKTRLDEAGLFLQIRPMRSTFAKPFGASFRKTCQQSINWCGRTARLLRGGHE